MRQMDAAARAGAAAGPAGGQPGRGPGAGMFGRGLQGAGGRADAFRRAHMQQMMAARQQSGAAPGLVQRNIV